MHVLIFSLRSARAALAREFGALVASEGVPVVWVHSIAQPVGADQIPYARIVPSYDEDQIEIEEEPVSVPAPAPAPVQPEPAPVQPEPAPVQPKSALLLQKSSNAIPAPSSGTRVGARMMQVSRAPVLRSPTPQPRKVRSTPAATTAISPNGDRPVHLFASSNPARAAKKVKSYKEADIEPLAFKVPRGRPAVRGYLPTQKPSTGKRISGNDVAVFAHVLPGYLADMDKGRLSPLEVADEINVLLENAHRVYRINVDSVCKIRKGAILSHITGRHNKAAIARVPKPSDLGVEYETRSFSETEKIAWVKLFVKSGLGVDHFIKSHDELNGKVSRAGFYRWFYSCRYKMGQPMQPAPQFYDIPL